MKEIRSIKDQKIVEARQLNKPDGRKELYLLEGEQIIEWALDSKIAIKHVFVSSDYKNMSLLDTLISRNISIYQCSDGIMRKINDSKYLTPIIGVAAIKSEPAVEKSDLILMLDDLQDQGNLGSIIRTASAFGIRHIIVSGRSADMYNKKTITASRGTVFQIQREVSDDSLATIKALQNKGYQVIATSPKGKQLQSLVKLEKKLVALIVGNETSGVDEAVMQQADVVVQIPMDEFVESLNVSVASGISLYELKLKVLIAMLTKNIRKTLGREIGVVHKLIKQAFDKELKKACDYSAQQVILLMIMVCDEKMSLRQIEQDLACYGGELAKILTPLIKDGLIEERDNNYSVLPHGEELLAKLWDVEKKTEALVLRNFTPQEKTILKDFITRVKRNCEDFLS